MGILAEDKPVTGNLTAAWDGVTPAAAPANTTVDVSQPANGSVGYQLSGTFVGTITFEASIDGANFVTVPATKLGATPVQATTATAAGIYVVHAPSARIVRARCSAYTSGTIAIKANGSVVPLFLSSTGGANPSGSQVQGLQPAGAAIVNNNPVLLGIVGSGGTVRLETIISALDNLAVPDAPGVGVLLRNGAAGNFFIQRGDALGQAIVVGSIAHDGVDAGNPLKIGARAIAHGTNPTAVSAADRTDLFANRAGVPFVIGGHPNIQTIRANLTGANTDLALITVATGLKIVVTSLSISNAASNSVSPSAVIGFGTANTPTTAGVIFAHPGMVAGSMHSRGSGSAIVGVGADDADLRITNSVPTSGSIDVVVNYFTIES